jgi:hypothetical protein
MGVGHGGADETHYKPNYLSIMNYGFQIGCTIPEMPLYGIPGQCDLSRYAFPTLDETDLDECAGIDQNTQRICILAVGGTLDSFPQGDDIQAQNGISILTGPNGSCDSATLNDDFAVAEDACLLAGENGLFEVFTLGDDIIDGLQILPGLDDLCQTTKLKSAYCIAGGPNGKIDTVTQGDDSDQYSLIGDGPNDVCETLVPTFDDQVNDDIQLGVGSLPNLERIDLGPIDWNKNDILEGLSCPPPGFTLPSDSSKNIVADLNRDSACVRPGEDGDLNSTKLGDDVISGETIFVGDNRICESKLEGDDVYPRTPQRSLGYVEPRLLTGYDDWNHLIFGFQAYPTYDDAAAASEDRETLEAGRAFLAGFAVPELEMTLAGPTEAPVGASVAYTATVMNVGDGPAIGGPAILRVKGVFEKEIPFLPIKLGIPTEIPFQHNFSEADVGQSVRLELELPYSGLFGGGSIMSATTNTLVTGVGGGNRAPTADAGPDQTVEATSATGANVTLDGSGSSDPDGDGLTYAWTGAFGTTSGVNPSVNLPLGPNDVSLVVNDGTVDSPSVTVRITVRDTTPPTVSVSQSPLASGNGWNNTNVEVTFQGSDVNGVSDPVTCNLSPQLIASEGANQPVNASCTDAANNSTPGSTQVSIDKTLPVASVSCPATVQIGANAQALVSVSDALSGVAGQSHADGNHPLDTASLGTKSFQVTASDNAGNQGSGSCSYEVLDASYVFIGFLAPVDNLPLINAAKAGQGLAMKWRIGDGQGGYRSDLGAVVSTRYALVSCPDEAETVGEMMEADDSGKSGLHFDEADQQFVYVWKTSKSMGGKCANFVLTLDDDSVHEASFAFR